MLGGLGVLAVHNEKYAIALALAVFAIGIIACDLTILPCVAVVGTLVVARVGSGTGNVSMSDVVLFLATFPALALLRTNEAPELRSLACYILIYEAIIFVAVLYHPYASDWVEWIHELFLAGGSLVIGWAVAREGKARATYSAFLVLASAIAIVSCGDAIIHHLHAASLPFGLQKNTIGDLLAFAALLAMANPSYVAWRGRGHLYALGLCIAGIGASQSRQAVIGLIIAAVIIARRGHGLGRRLKVLILIAIPAIVVTAIDLQLQVTSANQFNSAHQRLTWFHESIQLFNLSPVLGEGLRWWYTGRFSVAFQPPNAELEMLTSAGLLGIFAFFFCYSATLRKLWLIAPEFGTLAFAAILMRLVQGQLDIFWVTGQAAIPWMITGVALGAMARAHAGTVQLTNALPNESPIDTRSTSRNPDTMRRSIR